MRKLMTAILLAFAATGGSTLCLAADSATAEPAAAPAAATAHPSHREMHQMQQSGSEEQRPADATEDKVMDSDKSADEDKSQEQEPAQEQSSAGPAPSQRGMRQQLREALRNPSSGVQ